MINEKTKVCSEHLKPEDYLCGGENPHAPRCLLKSTAVPSLFPWTERTTTTSQRAGLELECELSSSDEESSVSTTESSKSKTDAENIIAIQLSF